MSDRTKWSERSSTFFTPVKSQKTDPQTVSPAAPSPREPDRPLQRTRSRATPPTPKELHMRSFSSPSEGTSSSTSKAPSKEDQEQDISTPGLAPRSREKWTWKEPPPARQTSQRTFPKSIPIARARKVVPPPLPGEGPQKRGAEDTPSDRRVRSPRVEKTTGVGSEESATPLTTSSERRRQVPLSSFFTSRRTSKLGSESGARSKERFTEPPGPSRSPPLPEDGYLRSISLGPEASTAGRRHLTKEEFEDEDFEPGSASARSKDKPEPSPRRHVSRQIFPEEGEVPGTRTKKVVPPPVFEVSSPEASEAEEDAGARDAREESRSPRTRPTADTGRVPEGSPRATGNRSPGRRSRSPPAGDAGESERPSYPKKSRTKRAARPGQKALREIMRLQRSTSLLIPRLPFSRVVRDTVRRVSLQDMRMTPLALEALQEATEARLVNIMEGAYACSQHAKRKTLMPRDLTFFLQICRSQLGSYC